MLREIKRVAPKVLFPAYKVENIDRVARELENLNARKPRIAVAHGQNARA